MILLLILFSIYILAVNLASVLLVKRQYDEWQAGDSAVGKSDGKLVLAAILGGAAAIYVTMFCLRYRLSNLLLMIAMPVIAAVNIYCFYIGFRSIYIFW